MFPEPPQLVQVAGNTVLFPVSTCDAGRSVRLEPGQPDSTRVTPEIVYAYRPWLAPDGTSLAYVQIGEPNQIVLAPIDQGQTRVLASSSAGLRSARPDRGTSAATGRRMAAGSPLK